MNFTIGIDVGGTFTDIVVAAADGETIIAKAATTPADQSAGVLDGIVLAAQLLDLTAAELLADTSRIVHGTTVATNALLEGKTAPVGLLTTEGHRDIIEMEGYRQLFPGDVVEFEIAQGERGSHAAKVKVIQSAETGEPREWREN